jgi:diaminobutyrate-2-oxoglutarate transaminase
MLMEPHEPTLRSRLADPTRDVLTTTHTPESWGLSPGTLGIPSADLGSNAYLKRQAAQESNARSYPRRIPIALQEGQGIYVKDTDGHVYIDCLSCA